MQKVIRNKDRLFTGLFNIHNDDRAEYQCDSGDITQSERFVEDKNADKGCGYGFDRSCDRNLAGFFDSLDACKINQIRKCSRNDRISDA